MTRLAAGYIEVAAGEHGGNNEGAGLDAVGNNAVPGAMQFFHSLNANGGGAGAFDFGAHLVEQRSEIGHLGLASAIVHQCFAFRQASRRSEEHTSELQSPV